MFIKTIQIQNFKCFGSGQEPIYFRVPDGEAGSGLNILVGENNSGKSTLMEAFDFLRNGTKKDIKDLQNIRQARDDEMFVEIVFSGNVVQVIDNFADETKKAALTKYVERDNEEILKVRRSSKVRKILQGKKEVEITPKKIGIWSKDSDQFENPSGIDKSFTSLFEIDFIWADTNPDEIAKFGATTICGKLLNEIVKSFEDTEEYEKFSQAHQKAFNDPKSGLKKQLEVIEERTKEIFNNQFGNATIKFHFDQVGTDSFFKNTKIKVNDGVETYLDEKGSGMQRSVALALLQVYAENLVKHPKNQNVLKPFFLFIDEPELCLHPQAQRKLLQALKEISKTQQVFLSVHSPYFVDPSLIANVYRFSNNQSGKILIESIKNKNVERNLNENRNFFFRHRDILFTDIAIFVEGVNDYEKYKKYCDLNGMSDLPKYFFMMNGCGQTFFFKEFCESFGVQYFAIVDRDFAFNKDNNWQPKNGKEKAEEVDIEDTMITKVIGEEIYVLRHGEVNDYLDHDGVIVNEGKNEKFSELSSIFQSIQKGIKSAGTSD